MPRRLLYPRHLTVRVGEDELRHLHARATLAGLSLSRYLVEAGLAEGILTPQDRAQREQALFHLRKVGVNLNQIARRLHRSETVSPAALTAALEATEQAVRQLAERAGR